VAQLGHPARTAFSDVAFDRSVVMGGRLVLVSQEGVLSTFLGAPGPGQFTAFGG
jgi:hypothetical protein